MESNRPRRPEGGRDPYATVLMVDSRGRVKTLSNFTFRRKLMVWTLCLALVLCAGMGYGLYRLWARHAALQAELSELRSGFAALQEDNERLMARLVIAGLPQPAPARSARVEAADAEPSAGEASGEPGGAGPEAEPLAPAAPPPPVAAEAEVDDGADAESDDPAVSVEVGNFEARYQKDGARLKVTYTLRNTGDLKAEGRSVAVFTVDGQAPGERFSVPEVPLVDGLPGGSDGRRFSIRQFMRVNLERDLAADGARLREAEVFVFSQGGRLITRKLFPVDLTLPGEAPTG